MGDVSLIARRKAAKSVEFGWSGNGGYFTMLGDVLLTYYQSPKMVNYLFSLGQFSLLREPLSEWETGIWRTRPTGEPHWQGMSELEIYEHLLFVDCVYFYDLDGQWYYVAPKALMLKCRWNWLAIIWTTRRGSSLFCIRWNSGLSGR